jgi:hypothetical protein
MSSYVFCVNINHDPLGWKNFATIKSTEKYLCQRFLILFNDQSYENTT